MSIKYNKYCNFIINYKKLTGFQQILLFNSIVVSKYFRFSFNSASRINLIYLKKLFCNFLFLYSSDFVNYFFHSFMKPTAKFLFNNKISSITYLKLVISFQLIIFNCFFLVFAFKRHISALILKRKSLGLFVLFKKLQLKGLTWYTFLLLIKKLFFIWKIKVQLYESQLKNITNCYIVLRKHNIFVTITSYFNEPLMVYSSGRAGFGQRTKQKKSTQAASKIALLICNHLKKKKYNTKLSIVLCTNKLFDKRIKSILSVFKVQRLTISSFVPRIIRYVGGVRPKKIRRV